MSEVTANEAINEALANTLVLLNTWAKFDTARQEGQLTPLEQIQAFGAVVFVMGTELLSVLDEFPEMAEEVYSAYTESASALLDILNEKVGN